MLLDCQHRINGQCQLANDLVSIANVATGVQCREDAFVACSKQQCPHSHNFVVRSLATSHMMAVGKIHKESMGRDFWEAVARRDECGFFSPGEPVPLRSSDCGTVLHDLLAKGGFELTEKCACKDWIQAMNRYGPKWSAKTKSRIVASMVREANERKIDLSIVGLKILVAKTVPGVAEAVASSIFDDALSKCRETGNEFYCAW